MATKSFPASGMTAPKAMGPASRARYWVIFFAVTLAILAYIDRVSISMAMPDIARDLGLDKKQQGWVFSAFAIAYAAFEIPGGWMGDKWGPRSVLMRIVLWWSAFTALTGAMTGYFSMLVTRFLFGAGEAGCFPNLTKAFTTWLPNSERVQAQGIMWQFARWGGAFTPPLVILVFQWMSWRGAFMLFGALGIVWAFFFYRWYRDNPKDHPSVNAAELALLAGNEGNAGGHGDVPWAKMFGSRTVMLLWVQYFLLSFPWYFYITWLPTYLQEARGLDKITASKYAVLPLLLGGLGSLTCGFVSARLARMTGSVRVARRAVAMVGFAGAAILLVASINTQAVLPAMLLMGMASFFNDLVMPGSWGACMDVGGKYAGTVSGSMNMAGNIAGFVAPPLGGYILASTNNDYTQFLYVMAGAYALGALCWPFIDPVTPIDPGDEKLAH
ncbi:MAG: MFS transporter [Acidobacteria bacterium]|nr:MFS transporter [Acidobacteriota bacterium]